jgi:dolichol-phosphate mannosyltransferase
MDGFRQTAVTSIASRELGETKYPFARCLILHGVLGFSDIPAASASRFIIAVIADCRRFISLLTYDYTRCMAGRRRGPDIPLSANLFDRVVGLYVGRIHTEVKQRPLYVVDRKVGLTSMTRFPTTAKSRAGAVFQSDRAEMERHANI